MAIMADGLVVTVAYIFACTLASGMSNRWFFGLSLAVFIGAFTAAGIYRMISSLSPRRQFMIAARAYFHAVGIFLLILILLRSGSFQGDLPIVFLLCLPPAYILVWSAVRFLSGGLARFRLGRWNTLVLGVDPGMERVLRRVRACPELGYEVVRVVKGDDTPDGFLRFDRTDMELAVAEYQVEMILLSSSQVNGSFDHLEQVCRENNVRMSILSRESDDLFTRTRIHDLAGIPLFWPERRGVEQTKRIVKRAFDLTASALLLIVLSPVLLLIAVATRLESPGPVIFRQKRSLSGLEPPFEFYKFRSMSHGAEATNRELAGMNESDGPLFKIRNDPRLTRVGRFIRRHSLDELPQLFNVLKGEMSLVGPRPLPVEDFALLRDRDHLEGFVRHRARTKPGMTGLWQISGRSDLGFREMVLLDLYYIRNQTILFDVEILVQTLPVVLFGRGAY